MGITPTIYIVGNTQSFISAFTAIQMLFNPANNTLWAGANYGNGFGIMGVGPVIMLGAVLSLIFMGMSAILKQRYEMHHILIMYGVYLALFIPTMTVNIENLYDGTSQPIQGIPIGIAIPGALISNISASISDEIGQAFQNVNATTSATQIFYNENGGNGGVYGFAGPLAALYNLRGLFQTMTADNPDLIESVVSYVGSCDMQNTNWDALLHSADMACTLFGTSEAGCSNSTTITPANADVTIYVNSNGQPLQGQGQTVSCSTAQSTLGSAFASVMSNGAPQGEMNANTVTGQQTQTSGRNAQSAQDTANLVGTLLQGTSNQGYQVMNNMILSCATQAGFNAGSQIYSQIEQDPLSPYCVTKAAALGRQQAMNAGAASLFETNMLNTMSVLQFLFFALAPLVAAVSMMMGTMSYSMWGKYFMFGAWTQSWMPVAALLNDYSQEQTSTMFNKIQAVSGGMPITSAAMLPDIFEKTMMALSNANMMLSMTPIITLAVLTGSYYALSQVAQTIQGRDVMDKNMSESTPTVGSSSLSGTMNGYDYASTGMGEVNRILPGQDAMSINLGSNLSSAAAASRTSALAAQESAVASAAVVGSQMWSYMQQFKSGVSSNTTQGKAFGDAINEAQMQAETVSALTQSSTQNAAKFSAALAGEAGVSSGTLNFPSIMKAAKKAGITSIGGLKLGTNLSAQQQQQVVDAVQSSNAVSLGKTLTSGETLTLVQNWASSVSDTAAQDQAGSLAQNAQKMRQAVLTAKNDATQAEQFQALAQQVQTAGGNAAINTTTLAQRVGQRFGEGAAGASVIQARMDQAGLGAQYQAALAQVSKQGNTDPLENAAAAAIMVGNRDGLGAAMVANMAFGQNTAIARQSMQIARGTPGVITGAAQQTNAAGNAAATSGVSGAIASTGAVTGAPTVGETAAEFSENQAKANAFRGGSGASSYNPNGPENDFMNAEAQMQGITPQQLAEARAMVANKNPAEIASLMQKHPLLAGAIQLAPGLLGQAAGIAVLSKMMKGNGGASGGAPDATSPGKTPPASDSPMENQAGELWYQKDVDAAIMDLDEDIGGVAENDADAIRALDNGDIGGAAKDLFKNIEGPAGEEPGELPVEIPDVVP